MDWQTSSNTFNTVDWWMPGKRNDKNLWKVKNSILGPFANFRAKQNFSRESLCHFFGFLDFYYCETNKQILKKVGYRRAEGRTHNAQTWIHKTSPVRRVIINLEGNSQHSNNELLVQKAWPKLQTQTQTHQQTHRDTHVHTHRKIFTEW